MSPFESITLYGKDILDVDFALSLAIKYLNHLEEEAKALGVNLPDGGNDEAVADLESLRRRFGAKINGMYPVER